MRPNSQKKKNHSGQVFEIVLFTVFAIVFLLVLTQIIKITKGVAKTVETPDRIARVQILFDSHMNEKADQFVDFLSNYKDKEIEFVIVEKDIFAIREINETFIINRDDQTDVSEKLANILGLDEKLIVQKPLSENKKHISLTLVIGNNADLILSKITKDEE